MCVGTNDDFSCSSTSKSQLVLHSNSTPTGQDIINLQSSMSYLPAVIALITFLTSLITLCVWNVLSKRQQKINDSDKVAKISKQINSFTKITRLLLWASSALTLTAAYSTTSTLIALKVTVALFTGHAPGAQITGGIAIQILQWATFALSTALAIYIHFFFRPSCESTLPTVNPFGSTPSTAQLLAPAPVYSAQKQDEYTFPPPPQNY